MGNSFSYAFSSSLLSPSSSSSSLSSHRSSNNKKLKSQDKKKQRKNTTMPRTRRAAPDKIPEIHASTPILTTTSPSNETVATSPTSTVYSSDRISLSSTNSSSTPQKNSKTANLSGARARFVPGIKPSPIRIFSDSNSEKKISSVRSTATGRHSKSTGITAAKNTKDYKRLTRAQTRLAVAKKALTKAKNVSTPPNAKAPSQARSCTRSSKDDKPWKYNQPISYRTVSDYRVTVIHDNLKIFVVDLLTDENGLKLCDKIRDSAEDHCDKLPPNEIRNRGWRKLYTYTKMDLPCTEVAELKEPMDNIMSSIKSICGKIFENENGCSNLRPRSWKEPHLLKYLNNPDKKHTGIEMHYDGCDITWSLMLTDSDEYDGGGTYMRCLRKTVKIRKGQVLVHPGELYHKGVPITSGCRLLAICFMDGFNPHIYDPSNNENDKKEYELTIIET